MNVEAWLTGRRGQALAVVVAVLGVVVLWFGIVAPVRSWFDDRATLLAQRRELLAHMNDLVGSLPALRAASADKHDTGTRDATIMLPGDSDAVAAADLQERVQKMASDGGATLTSVETLPPAQAAGHWHKVPLRVSVNASWPVLVALIRSIEQSPTRILIDDIRFRSPIAAVRPTEVPIQASMMLYGFRSTDVKTGT
jgi:type II secretory pathway component PulM